MSPSIVKYLSNLPNCCCNRLYFLKTKTLFPVRSYCKNNEDDSYASSNRIPFEYPKQKIYPESKSIDLRSIIESDFNVLKNMCTNFKMEMEPEDSGIRSCDILVIGGGHVGSSIAYWLKEKHRRGQNVLLLDSDFLTDRTRRTEFSKISEFEASGFIRQQYSLSENLALAKFSTDFIRENSIYNENEGNPIHVSFKPFGMLVLSDRDGAEKMKKNHILQRKFGISNEILTTYQMTQRFPWLNPDNINLGCHGTVNEGWVNPNDLLSLLRTKALKAGVVALQAEIVELVYADTVIKIALPGFERENYRPPQEIIVKKSDGSYQSIQFGNAVLALGPDTSHFTKNLLNINEKYEGVFGFEFPIERRKRYVFQFESEENGPRLSSPLILDSSGLFVKRLGLSEYVCGLIPIPEEEPNTDNLDVDYDFFNYRVRPLLVQRIPALVNLKLIGGYAYFIDQNVYDGNGLIGRLPAYHNIHVVGGFGSNSVTFAPAIGKAVSELIFDGGYTVIDLGRLSPNRLLENIMLTEEINLA